MGGIGLGIGIGRIMQNPSPLQIQGLQAWFEADSPNNFIKDASNYVSCWFDKSKGMQLGNELITNGGFDSGDGWTLNGVTIADGVAHFSNAGTYKSALQIGKQTVGKLYKATFKITNYICGHVFVSGGNTTVFSGNGNFTVYYIASQTYVGVSTLSDTQNTFDIDNVSVCEVIGNHLTQSTASSQPLLQTNSLNPNLFQVTFDGVNDYLKTLTFPLVQPFTIWIIFKQTILDPQADTYIFDGYSSTTILYYDHGNAKYRIYAGTAYPNSPYLFDGNYKFAETIFSGPSSKIIVNGKAGFGDAGANNADGFTLGNDRTGNVPSNISVYSVIIKQGAATPYEDNLVKNYIKRKLTIPGF